MLWTLIAVLIILWLPGAFALSMELAHLLLVVILIILIYQLVTGRRDVP